MLVIAIDWGAGAAWDASSRDPSPSATQATATTALPLLPADQLDERVDSPALADSPWRERYFSEFARLRYDYLPYLYSQAASTRGRFINTEGGVRRSYQADVTGDLPEVWFFGGSTMWGEGQRDLHTIPSEIARIAEAEGLPVRVTNRGERAYVIWQEALLFERSLASDPRPDLAVFYDGANELGVQDEHAYPDPTVAAFDFWSEQLTGRALEPGQAPAQPEPDIGMRAAVADLWDDYRSTSALGRAVANAGSLFAVQSAAAQSGDDETPARDDPHRTALGIYERGRSLAQLIGREHDVTTMFFWQPFGDDPSYRVAARQLAPDTIDISAALDAVTEPVYLDPVHTNELGARVVAEALWEQLRPRIRAWYAAR